MTASIYVGAPTAWQHARTIENRAAAAQVSREKRVATRQANRVMTIAVLTLLSLIEGATVVMGSHYQIEDWLMVTSAVCIFFNIPLIVWLGRLYIRDWQRENQIRKQYKG